MILHTNDVHGQVSPRPAVWLEGVNPLPDCGGLPRLAARLRQVRGLMDFEAGAGERAAQLVADPNVVFDEQDGVGLGGHRRGPV